MNPRKVQDSRNPPDLMILGNGLLEIEAIEQLSLVSIEPPPSSSDLAKCRITATESRFGNASK
jgi:hypothetical protein